MYAENLIDRKSRLQFLLLYHTKTYEKAEPFSRSIKIGTQKVDNSQGEGEGGGDMKPQLIY